MRGEISSFLGWDAVAVARRMVARGLSGVVVGVRLPPSSWPVSQQRGWTSVVVTIGAHRREFFPTLRREPWVIELAAGDHVVRATGSEAKQVLEQHFSLLRGDVFVVSVRPPCTWGLFITTSAELSIGPAE